MMLSLTSAVTSLSSLYARRRIVRSAVNAGKLMNRRSTTLTIFMVSSRSRSMNEWTLAEERRSLSVLTRSESTKVTHVCCSGIEKVQWIDLSKKWWTHRVDNVFQLLNWSRWRHTCIESHWSRLSGFFVFAKTTAFGSWVASRCAF